jgi:hypothetical protein
VSNDLSTDQTVDDWSLMGVAPKDATEVTLFFADGSSVVAHWAHGGGEDQPPFGPAWFKRQGDRFVEIMQTPIGWRPVTRPANTQE